MRWLLRLIRLKNNKGQSFLEHFARHMYTHTEGVPQDCWEEVATWAGMPELMVDMCLEVEVDVLISQPMNAVFYQACEGRPCGFVVDELAEHVHDTWRPLIERLADNPLSELPHTAAAIRSLNDHELRTLKTKQVHAHMHITGTCTDAHIISACLFCRCTLLFKLPKRSLKNCIHACMRDTCFFYGFGILPFLARLPELFAVSLDSTLAQI